MLSPNQWLSLPYEIRNKLRKIFNIGRSGSTEVVNGVDGSQVISDGTTAQDLSVISIKKMQDYLGVEETEFDILFTRLKNSFNPPIILTTDEAILVEDINHIVTEEDVKNLEDIVEIGEEIVIPVIDSEHIEETLPIISAVKVVKKRGRKSKTK